MAREPALDPLSRRSLIGFALRLGALTFGGVATIVLHLLEWASAIRLVSARALLPPCPQSIGQRVVVNYSPVVV